jgi:hypothetical protein
MVIMTDSEKGKKFKSINISRRNYDTMVELGDMTKSFDSVLTEIMKKANVYSSAASAKTDD